MHKVMESMVRLIPNFSHPQSESMDVTNQEYFQLGTMDGLWIDSMKLRREQKRHLLFQISQYQFLIAHSLIIQSQETHLVSIHLNLITSRKDLAISIAMKQWIMLNHMNSKMV